MIDEKKIGVWTDELASKAPVPGGVGAVTTAVLAKHLVQAALRKQA